MVKPEDIKVIENFAEMREILLFATDHHNDSDISYNIRVNDRVVTDTKGFIE